MDPTALQILKSIDELSSKFTSRMEEFEKKFQQPPSTASNPTVKELAAEFLPLKIFVWSSFGIFKSQVDLLVANLDRLETHLRRKVLIFHGIKEEKDEDILKSIGVLSNTMKLPEVGPEVIESYHRLGTKKDSARPIIVRFTNMQLRASVWKNKTKLKGSKITVTEFLTKSRQEVFAAARNHFGVKRCWCADGIIFILLPDKNRVKIISSSELKQLVAKYPKDT